jgi:Transposase family tnp2
LSVCADDIADAYHGSTWQKLFKGDAKMNGDARNIAFAFATDGFAPWNQDSYSCWAFAFTPLNFPPFLRYVVLHALYLHNTCTVQVFALDFLLLCDVIDLKLYSGFLHMWLFSKSSNQI